MNLSKLISRLQATLQYQRHHRAIAIAELEEAKKALTDAMNKSFDTTLAQGRLPVEEAASVYSDRMRLFRQYGWDRNIHRHEELLSFLQR